MTPKELIQKWVSVFNQANAQVLTDFYAEDAVNHQIPNEPVRGKAAIQAMFAREFSQAKMVCLIENLFEDGNWAILEWKDPEGLRGCGFFKIENGKIVLQRGYWDKLTFLRVHQLPLPKE